MKTLSDKGYYCKNKKPMEFVYEEGDVKEFIKQLKAVAKCMDFDYCSCCEMWLSRIDKLAGDKLIEEQKSKMNPKLEMWMPGIIATIITFAIMCGLVLLYLIK